MTRSRFAILSASPSPVSARCSSRRRRQARHPAASNPHLGNRESIRGGMALYRVRCADCHGLDGTGYRGPDLVAALGGGMADERLFDTIRKGVPGTEMPAASPIDVADDDILQLISYLKSIGSVAPAERPIGNAGKRRADCFRSSARPVTAWRDAADGSART